MTTPQQRLYNLVYKSGGGLTPVRQEYSPNCCTTAPEVQKVNYYTDESVEQLKSFYTQRNQSLLAQLELKHNKLCSAQNLVLHLNDELAKMVAQTHQLEKQNKSLAQQGQADSAEYPAKVAQLQFEVRRLKDLVARQEEQLKGSERSRQQLKQMNSANREQSKQLNQKLFEKLEQFREAELERVQAARHREIQAMQQQVVAQQKANAQLTAKLAAEGVLRNSLQAELRTALVGKQKAAAEQLRLGKELVSSKAEVSELRLRLQTIGGQLLLKDREINQLKVFRQRLQVQVQVETSKNKQLAGKINELREEADKSSIRWKENCDKLQEQLVVLSKEKETLLLQLQKHKCTKVEKEFVIVQKTVEDQKLKLRVGELLQELDLKQSEWGRVYDQKQRKLLAAEREVLVQGEVIRKLKQGQDRLQAHVRSLNQELAFGCEEKSLLKMRMGQLEADRLGRDQNALQVQQLLVRSRSMAADLAEATLQLNDAKASEARLLGELALANRNCQLMKTDMDIARFHQYERQAVAPVLQFNVQAGAMHASRLQRRLCQQEAQQRYVSHIPSRLEQLTQTQKQADKIDIKEKAALIGKAESSVQPVVTENKAEGSVQPVVTENKAESARRFQTMQNLRERASLRNQTQARFEEGSQFWKEGPIQGGSSLAAPSNRYEYKYKTMVGFKAPEQS